MFILQPRARVRHNVTRTRTSWGYFVARCSAEGTSKAWVAGRVGKDAALTEERGYVSHVLTRGVAVGIRDTLRGDVHGVLRAGAIVIGTGVTAFSYFRARPRLHGLARRGRIRKVLEGNERVVLISDLHLGAGTVPGLWLVLG